PAGLGLEISNVPSRIETLNEFRFAARCLRDLTSAWKMFRDGRRVTDFEWVSPASPFEAQGEPLHLLTAMLARFLRYFSPQLEFSGGFIVAEADPKKTERGVRAEPRRGPTSVPLYAICALELFNHIIEDAEYRVCANERCQRTFVHQQGRSLKGQ